MRLSNFRCNSGQFRFHFLGGHHLLEVSWLHCFPPKGAGNDSTGRFRLTSVGWPGLYSTAANEIIRLARVALGRPPQRYVILWSWT